MRQEKIYPIGTNVYLDKEDLEKLHTKQLIEIKHIISSRSCLYDDFDYIMYKWDDPYWIYVNVRELTNILSRRPHYPTHKENTEKIKRLIALNKRKTKRKNYVKQK